MSIKIIACEVIKEEILAVQKLGNVDFEFVGMGFHLNPDKLKIELQRLLNSGSGYSRIILSFGLCGGAAKGLKAPVPLTIPRIHDCIPLILGSKRRFDELRSMENGTLYLSCGWMKGERSFLSEYNRTVEKYGEETALDIYKRMYDGYKRVLFVSTGSEKGCTCMEESKRIAGILNLKHETLCGDLSYIKKIVNGPWDDSDFINIEPGEVIKEEYFF
ncbi:MAG TPA: DUF1638 domain-containing protein [Clostridia bacterium]